MMNFRYYLIEEWPPLAWAAQCIVSNAIVTVYHGASVEVQDAWFCEAVWDGEYEAGGFDTTDIVFGSGGRIRENQVIFVSSGSTVDRLQSLACQGGYWISNSLACLLTVTDTEPDPGNPQYFKILGSITKGLNKYERELPVSDGNVQLTYFKNLKWDGSTLVEVDKPNAERDFSTFTKYHEFLLSSIGRISDNVSAAGRRHPYQMLGTLSSGYDSTTNTVLAQEVGLQEAISFSEARSGDADDGKEIADILGIQLTLIPRDSWKSRDLAEVPFIAADAKGEDVYFGAAAGRLSGRVLLTGFHGDKVWGKETYTLDPTIVRGDRSGLSLTEYRLWTGFIHFPIPFMGVRQIREINAISNSPEMKPWDVPGNYSRPVCRRIVEGAGVPRNKFGMSKKAASVLFGASGDVLSPATRSALHEWLRSQSKLKPGQGKIPSQKLSQLMERFSLPYKVLVKGIKKVSKLAPRPVRSQVQQVANRLDSFERNTNPFSYAFPWAIMEAKAKYKAYQKYKK